MSFSINKNFKVEIFMPKLQFLQKHRPFSLIYLIWYIFTLGKYKIIYVFDNEKLIHYSHVLPGFWKFRFMNRDDYEIGPCWTDELYRGQQIYPYVIQKIVELFKNDAAFFYMVVDEKNIASIRGIEKAGFIKVGIVKKTKFLGIYYKI